MQSVYQADSNSNFRESDTTSSIEKWTVQGKKFHKLLEVAFRFSKVITVTFHSPPKVIGNSNQNSLFERNISTLSNNSETSLFILSLLRIERKVAKIQKLILKTYCQSGTL